MTSSTFDLRPSPVEQATEKQKHYLDRLISYRLEKEGVEVPSWKGYPQATKEQVVNFINGLLNLELSSLDHLTRRDASRAINELAH